MKRKVVLVELNVNRNVLPLVSGYLQTYACAEKEIGATHEFVQFTRSLRDSRQNLLLQLLQQAADIYGFSCYVWNMKLIRYLVRELALQMPHARIIMGGPQVDGHGEFYLEPHNENIYVGNGEGERVFRNFLLAAHSGGDCADVAGLTFYRDGEIVNTPRASLIEDINDIPSPFLAGIYDGVYSTTVFETNRGCPFACTFCYWGKGEDRMVRKFDMDRLNDELEWLAHRMVSYIHIGDSNWGMFQRDTELSEKIVRCKQTHGAPLMITFSGAKAKIDSSSKIAAMFHDAGIVSAQAIGIQSTTDQVLKNIRRQNISLPALMEYSIELERRGISTYAELIWPLPGETLASFKECITSLCGSEVTSVVIYPALLLFATPMEHQVKEFGIETVSADDDVSELQLISATRHVSHDECLDGIWLIYAVYCLYNARTLRFVGKYLNDNNLLPWAQLCWSFLRFCRANNTSSAQHWAEVVSKRTHAEQHGLGKLIHIILHEKRREYLEVLIEFAQSQDWWMLEEVRALFELDLVNCPYIYANTDFFPVAENLFPLKYLEVSDLGERRVHIAIDRQHLNLASEYLFGESRESSGVFEVAYQHKQFAFMPGKPLHENYTYVYGMIHRGAVILPRWSAVAAPASGSRFPQHTDSGSTSDSSSAAP